ncbi:interferon alpha/beta receptor 1 isoform X2 [Hemicordylus capensis]|nr:interferon alpha/beta receptor 1 isoform X2 [Hemicordylus capensis]
MCLQQPQNVSVHIVDRNIILKWDWDNPCGLNVTFSAWYQQAPSDYEMKLESWRVASECLNVTVTECDLSSTIVNYLEIYTVNLTVESEGNRSPWASLEFNPFYKAVIGPPEVQLKSVDEGVKINIIHAEATQAMWELETFNYKLTIWKNSSSPEEKTQDIWPGQIIDDLEPGTTYCLKVKAHLSEHNGLYSPITCIQTKARVGLPRPTNLRVHALDTEYVLYWDDLYDGNVNFMVQLMLGFKKRVSHDISKEWEPVSGCENTTRIHCDFSSAVRPNGISYLRVQAMNGHNKSPWSEELQFVPKEHNEMGPPGVSVDASEDVLYVSIEPPRNSIKLYVDLSYRTWYWEASSNAKRAHEYKSAPFTISGLTPSTLYCLKVQAFTRIYNKSSAFSNVTCMATDNGPSSYPATIIFAITLTVCIFTAGLIYLIYRFCRPIKDAFFPSCSPPKIIESIGGKNVMSSYLLTAEEPTESCVVIVDNRVTNEINLLDTEDNKQSDHSSQDSGNYSNDDISGNKESHETSEQETG